MNSAKERYDKGPNAGAEHDLEREVNTSGERLDEEPTVEEAEENQEDWQGAMVKKKGGKNLRSEL